MKISVANRLWIGLVSGAIGALIAGILLALFGLPEGIFGTTITVSLIGTVILGAMIGLVYGLVTRPNPNYLQATLGGLVLGLIVWAVLAIISPLFIPTDILTGFNLTSLIGLLLFGAITALTYSLIGSSFATHEEPGHTRRESRPYGTTGGQARSRWSSNKHKGRKYPEDDYNNR